MEADLASILINTYNPNAQLRSQAENLLKEFFGRSGFLLSFLRIIGGTDVSKDLRQAATIALKNNIRNLWSHSTSIREDEAVMFKEQLLSILLVETDSSLRGLLAEIVRIVADTDFPDKWSSLLPTLMASIQSMDILRLFNALTALRKIFKKFEFKRRSARADFDGIINSTFPLLQNLMTNIVENNSLEAAHVMRLCLKIFHSSVLYSLPVELSVSNGVLVHSSMDFALWFSLIAKLLEKPLPEASEGKEPFGQPMDEDERRLWPWWKMKKWTARIVTHFLQRYGNSSYCGEEYKHVGVWFRDAIIPVVLRSVFQVLYSKSNGVFVTEDVHRGCITFISNCCEMSGPFKIIKPQMDFLLFDVIFPTLLLTPKEIEMFDTDPSEFMRKVHTTVQEWVDPRTAAITLLQTLAKYRQKYVVPKLMPFINTVLTEYNAAAPNAKNYRYKDGVMSLVALLFKIFSTSSSYQSLVEPFILHHLVPELHSNVNFLRFRACWCVEYISLKKFETPGAVATITEGLINCLRDKELPVQASAAVAIQMMMEFDEALEILRPYLLFLIGEYFRIMGEIENESLISALQSLVMKYGDAIKDVAPQMIQHLAELFVKFAAEGQDDDEVSFLAVQCLETVIAILEAVEEHEDIMGSLEGVLAPIIMKIFAGGDDSFEYIESGIQMVNYLTYNGDVISPTSWTYCGEILYAFNEWAFDFALEIMTPILNYLIKGLPIFLTSAHKGIPLTTLFFQVIRKLIEYDCADLESEWKVAATMLSCFITSAKPFPQLAYVGSGDPHHQMKISRVRESAVFLQEHERSVIDLFPNMLSLISSVFGKAQMKSTKIRMMEVILAMFYFNAEVTLQLLIQLNSVDFVFKSLFDLIGDMDRIYTERLIVLSFTNILSLPPQSLPPIIASNALAMFKQAIREIELIDLDEKDSKENRKRHIAYDGDDEYIDEDDGSMCSDDDDDNDCNPSGGNHREAKIKHGVDMPEGGFDEDTDCVNAEDEEYYNALERMTREERVRHELGEDIDDEELDNEAYIFTSPIEVLDNAIYFLDHMQMAMQSYPDRFHSIFNELNADGRPNEGPTDLLRWQGLLNSCENRKQLISQRVLK